MRTRRVVSLVCLLWLAPAAAAFAELPRGVMWARVTNDGTVVADAYSSSGGAVTVTKRIGGTYQVRFAGNDIASGIGHAVAFGGNRYCNIGRARSFPPDMEVDVDCFTGDGARASSDFVVLFYKEQRATADWNSAYAFANQPAAAAYTPAVQWHGRGGTVGVRRVDVGRYGIDFPGISPLPSLVNFLVTPYDANAHCRIGSYSQGRGGGSSVGVTCLNPANQPVDVPLMVSAITDFAIGRELPDEQRRGAFIRRRFPLTGGEAVPPVGDQYTLGTGPAKVRRLALGQYEVDAPGLSPTSSVVMVVAAQADYCSVGAHRAEATGMVVPVSCYSGAGVAIDSGFHMTILTNDLATAPMPGGSGLARATAWLRFTGTPSFAADPRNQYNPTGALNTAEGTGAGGTRVSFPGLATVGGIAHASSNGTGSCKVDSWGPNGTALDVHVVCFNAGGSLSPEPFTLLFYKEDRGATAAPAAYARAMIGNATATYDAPAPFAWSGFGSPTQITRTAVGLYTVRFGPVVGTPKLLSIATAYGGTAPRYCKADISGTDETTVSCYDENSNYADSDFGVSVFADLGFGADPAGPGQTGAYVRGHVNGGTYPPTPGYSSTTGGAISITRTGTGVYAVDMPELKPTNRTVAIASARGAGGLNGAAQCRPANWSAMPPAGGGTRVNITCYNAGVAVDEAFTLIYLTDAGTGAPAISPLSDRMLPRGSSTGLIPFTISDDTNPDTVVLTASSSNPTLIPVSNILMGGSGANRTLTVFAPPDKVGSAAIVLTARDESGFTSVTTFTVTVTTVHTLSITKAGGGTGTVTSQPPPIACGQVCNATFVEASSVTLTATPAPGSTFAGWSGAGCSGTGTCVVTMDAAKSVTATFGLAPKTYYLAEGATGSFFDLDVVIANPNDVDVPVEVTFLDAGGHTYPLTFTLGAKRSRTVAVESEVPALANAEVSTIVTSPTGQPLVVERSLFWDQSYYGGHTGSAVDGPQTTWYFGEGFQSAPVFDTFILLANANTAPAQVTLTFLRQGSTPVTTTRTVPPSSRATFWAAELAAELNGQSFSTAVTSDVPIIAERAMYFGTPTFNGGHESAGVSAPATSWFHAEGRTGSFFDTYILIGNPGNTPANVTVRFLRANDTPITTTVPVAAQGRETIYVDGIPGLADVDVSTEVTSDVPVISERAMYWPGDFAQWYEAHNSFGVTSTGLAWGLSEGRFGFPQQFETYILLTNPTATPTRVRVTFLRQGSKAPVVSEQLLAANARANVDMSALLNAPDFDSSGERFGALVESLDNVGIVVERALYFSTGGVFWAGGTNATAVKIR